jgi:hypothetical protein
MSTIITRLPPWMVPMLYTPWSFPTTCATLWHATVNTIRASIYQRLFKDRVFFIKNEDQEAVLSGIRQHTFLEIEGLGNGKGTTIEEKDKLFDCVQVLVANQRGI